MLHAIADFAQKTILEMGYLGIFVLMVLESTMVPVPSTLVMPFAGYLAAQGHFSLPLVIAMNGAGAIVGSLACYWLGAAGGKPLLLKYGKYVLVKKSDVEKTEKFFESHGSATVFIARLLPVIRHFISIPAGIARMNMGKFLLQTFLGATLWGGGLAVLGYQIGANWSKVGKYMKRVDLIFGALVAVVLLVLLVRWLRKRKAPGADAAAAATTTAAAASADADSSKG
ncbi:MAG: DedA family protein [Deltaproteobacteria bacterium]|nr:DedA family protein [Deltaproteobacteria bacterium]